MDIQNVIQGDCKWVFKENFEWHLKGDFIQLKVYKIKGIRIQFYSRAWHSLKWIQTWTCFTFNLMCKMILFQDIHSSLGALHSLFNRPAQETIPYCLYFDDWPDGLLTTTTGPGTDITRWLSARGSQEKTGLRVHCQCNVHYTIAR